ncbi:MAG: serine--tRNA ligase [Candidatus Nanoarchaeia archaeon]
MLDIELFRTNPQIIKDSQKKRNLPLEPVNQVIDLDNHWRDVLQKLEKLKHARNLASENINKLKKAGKPVEAEIKKVKKIVDEIQVLEKEAEAFKAKRNELLMNIPNIVDESVPVGDASKNKVLEKWGKIPNFRFEPKGHEELGKNLDVIDIERAAKTTGARFYYLKGDLVKLNYAIINFALDLLKKKGFTLIQPPYMLRRNILSGAIPLATFEEMIYKIQDEDLYLIGTAEHALNAYYADEILPATKLPIRFAGISPCFRKEAGAHGKDTKGIFRTHQFEKVEQFVFCRPENAWKEFDLMLKNTKAIFRALEIPYRTVVLSSEEIGRVAVKTVDIEGWFPSQNAYRELGSCSNCTDYQARRSNIKFVDKGKIAFVATLNNTAVATERAIACLMENHQQKDGSIKIPKALWPYTKFRVISC